MRLSSDVVKIRSRAYKMHDGGSSEMTILECNHCWFQVGTSTIRLTLFGYRQDTGIFLDN